MSVPLDVRKLEERFDQDVIFTVTSQTQLATQKTKVYKYRWVVLLLFMASIGINGFQWIQYSIISNVVQKHYSVDSVHVDWLSIIFMVAYLPFNFPALWLMNKKGLRVITILGSAFNFFGAWIKVISVRPDLFYVTFIGQIVAGVGQVFTVNVPSRLAAVWFGQDQVSTACSIGVFGNQLGLALGFFIPPILVKPHENIYEIGSNLSNMCFIMAGTCSIHLVLTILFFKAEPELPPSPGQAIRKTETPVFIDSLKRLAKNRGFVILTISYGLIIGVFGAISTVLNQIVLEIYPGHEEDAGRIGLTIMVAGMIGSVFSGFVLDKTHKFKTTALALYVFSTAAMFAFTFTLHTNLGVVYCIAALLGFFMTAFLLVGFEFGAEITYPEPEGTTAGIISTSSISFSILLTLVTSALLNAVGVVWSNAALAVMLLIGTILTTLIKEDLRRQSAHARGEGRN